MGTSGEIKEPCAGKWWFITIGLCLLICIGGFILTLYLSQNLSFFPTSQNDCPPALFGDSFGAVNALISAFAFAGMIVTFVLQRYELSMQRKELESQRMEFSSQNETLRLQRFENTFFNMLELQQSIVNDLYVMNSNKESITEDNPNDLGKISKDVIIQNEYRGRNLFYYAFHVCKHYIEPTHKKVNGLCGVLQEKGKCAFNDYYTTTVFDHYFRHLYTILKFIKQNAWLGKDEQYKYATFVRATLSRYELVMLYYNGLFHPKMKSLMEEFSLLNNLRRELLPPCYENRRYLEGLGISDITLRKNDFSGSDFEFFLSDKEDDCGKYFLGAFYTKEELDKGKELLGRWSTFVNNIVDIKPNKN